jgi:hypothetical protein
MRSMISGIGDMDYELCKDGDNYVLFGITDSERVEVSRDVTLDDVFSIIKQYESR